MDTLDRTFAGMAAAPAGGAAPGTDTWTPARIARLTALWASDMPVRQIAEQLETTRNAIIGKAHRLALSPRVIRIKPSPPRNVFEFAGPSCLWPIGHPGEEDFHFCCARPVAGKRYCAEHAARAYLRPKGQKPERA